MTDIPPDEHGDGGSPSSRSSHVAPGTRPCPDTHQDTDDLRGVTGGVGEQLRGAAYELRRTGDGVRVSFATSAVAELTGFAPAAFEGRPELFVERLHPDDVHRREVRELPEQETTIRVRFRHADGRWLWLDEHRTPIIEDGCTVGMLVVLQDVTAQEEANTALHRALEAERAATDRLLVLDQLKDQFLQAVSHELRTPLTAITGFAQMLVDRREILTDTQVADFSARILANSERLGDLLTDLLDADTLRGGIVRLDLAPTNLVAVVEAVATSIDLGERTCIIDTSPATAVVDERKLARIIHALLANVAKHTPEGTTVTVTCRVDDDRAIVDVSDNGPGVPPEIRELIFEPFWQSPGMHGVAQPGTGIGLSLAQRFAGLHGGSIVVEDAPEGGARFRLTLSARGRPRTSRDRPGSARAVVSDVGDEPTTGGYLRFRELMDSTLDELSNVRTPTQATGLLLRFVQQAGAELAQRDPDDPRQIDVDVSLGAPQPLRPSLPPGSRRRRLEHHLPFLLQHASAMLARHEERVFATDPAAGLYAPDALDRLLDHLHEDDAMILARLPDAEGGHDGGPSAQLLELAGTARQLGRQGDHAVLAGRGELLWTLGDTTPEQAAAVVDRLREAWDATSGTPGSLATVARSVGLDGGRVALATARAQLSRSPDRC